MVTINVKKHTVAAFALALLAGSAANVHAVLLPNNGSDVIPTTATAGDILPGAVVGSLFTAFGPSLGGSPPFTGFMSSYAVQRTAPNTVIDGINYVTGGLDFYYQISLTSVGSNPTPDIEEWNYSPLPEVPFGPFSVENLSPTVLSLPGTITGLVAGFTANGTQAPGVVNYDGNVIAWDFTNGPGNDTRLTPTLPKSVWQILHTNATQFSIVDASVQDSGVAPTKALSPVPEPTSAIFGVGLLGVLGASRRARRTKSL